MKTRSSLSKPLTLTLSPSNGERGTMEKMRVDRFEYAKSDSKASHRAGAQKRPLLLLSEDEVFCWRLLMTASQVGRRLVRGHPTADGPQMLRIVNPEVVLLDLDLHEEMAWAAADALLLDEYCPPLILLTSQGKQSDFETAIQAGCLIEKTIEPMRLLAVVEQKLASTRADQREQSAVQRLVIRWLKPMQIARLNRFWGINE